MLLDTAIYYSIKNNDKVTMTMHATATPIWNTGGIIVDFPLEDLDGSVGRFSSDLC
jgi:hypothetical protein